MSGGIATITISHRPTPIRTCEGEARLGTGLPTSSALGGLSRLQPPYQHAAKRAVSIGGDPIATGSLPARRYGVADDPQDQIILNSPLHLPASTDFLSGVMPGSR